MSGAHLSATAFRAGPAYQRVVAAWLPCARAASRHTRALRALSGPRASVPTDASRPRIASRAPTVSSSTASPRAPLAAAIRSRSRVSERVDAAVYTVHAPVSAPAPPRFSRLPSTLILSTLILVGRRRSPPNRRAARRLRPRLAMSPNTALYATSRVAPPSTCR
jgi:hypothetical protein